MEHIMYSWFEVKVRYKFCNLLEVNFFKKKNKNSQMIFARKKWHIRKLIIE